MTLNRSDFEHVISVLVRHMQAFLETQFGVPISNPTPAIQDLEQIDLHHATAVIALGGTVSLLVVITLEKSLLNYLLDEDLKKNGISIADAERSMFEEEFTAELLNVVLGHCTADLEKNPNKVTLSPPAMISQAKSIRRPKDCLFINIELNTPQGQMEVDFVGPRELFDTQLNLIYKAEEMQ